MKIFNKKQTKNNFQYFFLLKDTNNLYKYYKL